MGAFALARYNTMLGGDLLDGLILCFGVGATAYVWGDL